MAGPPVYPFMKKVNIPRNGLVAEYLFSNNVLDTSGNSYDGIANALTYGNDRHSNPNSAGVFNGSTSFVDIDASLAGLSTNIRGTFSTWVKPTDPTPTFNEEILAFGDTDANEFLNFFVSSTGVLRSVLVASGAVVWDLETDSAVFSTNWVHVAIVQDAIEAILYVSGSPVAQSFSTEIDKTKWFNWAPGIDKARIGDLNYNNNGEILHFDGSLDDIRLYNRALSQSEITVLANE